MFKFLLRFHLGLLITAANIQAASISGTISYEDEQSGSVHIKTTRTQTGNRTLKLDGDGDSVEVESLTDLSGSELTVQYWFKGSSIQSAVRQQSGGWIVAGWNNLHILSQDGGTGGIDAGNAVDGKWHHLLLSWKQGAANGFRSYLDGQLVASRDAADAPIPAHNAALYFGAFNGVGEFTNGELDEIAVWTKSMTDEEVASNWYKKLSGNEDGLAGYWDFDDDTADDRSGNEHHGTFLGDSITIESNIPGLDAYFATTLTEPGAFKLDNLPNGNGYEVDAFMDVNGNGRVDKGEPSGAFSGNPITVSGDHIDVDFTLIELPSITSNPEDIRVAAGEDITLAIMVSGSQPMTFEWRKNGVLIQDSGSISGTDSAVLLISGAKGSDSGTYN